MSTVTCVVEACACLTALVSASETTKHAVNRAAAPDRLEMAQPAAGGLGDVHRDDGDLHRVDQPAQLALRLGLGQPLGRPGTALLAHTPLDQHVAELRYWPYQTSRPPSSGVRAAIRCRTRVVPRRSSSVRSSPPKTRDSRPSGSD
jgi:hypothetical protein